jgi:hypothetical protein
MERLFRWMVVGMAMVLVLGVTSCALGPEGHARRFHEAELADLIIRHSTEETIFRLRPEASDGPFMQIFNREEICASASQMAGERNLAVVLIDRFYSPTLEQELVNSWVGSLQPLRFERVVFLRNNGSDSVNGLPIVADVALPLYASSAQLQQRAELRVSVPSL